MSMYTQLLDAAVGQREPVGAHPTRPSALDARRRRRGELNEGIPPATDPDAVPVVLARENAYDMALLELSELMGIKTDLHRFEQPQQERARLEEALRDCGVGAPTTTDSFEAVRYRWPRCATPGSIAH
jgi:hypothetical protein